VTPDNEAAGIQINQHTTYEEREAVAEMCTTNLEISIPAIIDKIDNAVSIGYGGFPDRIYVIGSDGVVRFKTRHGPFGWNVPEARAALIDVLAE
jgi:hypothetical protein